jgi:four helix bundle protein
MPNSFRVLDLARLVADEINEMIRARKPRLIHLTQIEDSAESVPANIREALGKRIGPERNQFYRHARGSAEETDEHLRANVAARRLSLRRYWQLRNRILVIIKSLNRLMGE